ncbi:hypothetical protein DL767_000734 [Monosporascus sp. MG133]|nr:hypothetical protein DL767_000734 [Monosporascus sp. MG133]
MIQPFEIFEWLKEVSEGKKGGESPKKEDVRRQLVATYRRIQRLCLEVDEDAQRGRDFRVRHLKPDCHILRQKDRNWTILNKTWKYNVRPIMKLRDYGPEGDEQTLFYWCPYDLLGRFLSLLGPAPPGAAKNTYFLPLTAVYGQWCSKIAGDKTKTQRGNGSGDWPYMFQCTWYEDKLNGSIKLFRLGASLAGAGWETGVGSWRYTVGKSRFDILRSARTDIVCGYKYPSLEDYEKQKDLAQGARTAYGNCAETYPFTGLMVSKKANNDTNLFGLALRRHYIDPALEDYDCFRDAGASWTNFHKNYDKARAPARP